MTSAGPAMTPASPGERRAGAEHEHEYPRHVVAKHGDHVRMRQRRLDDDADPRPRQREEERGEHRHRRQQHEHTIGRIGGVEQAKRHEIQRGRHAIVDRQFAPEHLHDLFDDEGEPESEQKLGDVAEAMQPPQAVALDQRADNADDQRREDEPRPEADPPADLEAEIGAEHVEARVGEVEHAHHAEDQRQAARHHEQQHAVEHAVEGREGDKLKHPSPAWRRSAAGGRPPRSAVYGRSILQVVGRTVSLALTSPTVFQPQPVASSSNLASGSSGPKLPMYMSVKS